MEYYDNFEYEVRQDGHPEIIPSRISCFLFSEDGRDYIVIKTYTFGEVVKGETFTAEASCDLKVYLDNGEYKFVDLVLGEACEKLIKIDFKLRKATSEASI